MQIPIPALANASVRVTETTAQTRGSAQGSGASLEVGSKANQPIEDKAEITREGRLQNQLLRGLLLRYSYAQSPVEITAATMNDAMSNWAKQGNLSLDDVKIMAVAYAYAADNGYDISVAANFECDYSFWAGVNKKTFGEGPASRADEVFAHKFLASTAFETSQIPKDFLLMSFDPLRPTARGTDARFVADYARYLSDVPKTNFDGNAKKAERLLQDYRKRLDL